MGSHLKDLDFDFDCMVVGGGIVGLTAVLELSRLGFSVLFIEKYRPKKGPFDLNTYIRNVSISHASNESLARHIDLPFQYAANSARWLSGRIQHRGSPF